MTPAETVCAVDHVDLAVEAGDFLCLHGASGSGKSTLLNILAGIELADEGTVEVAGQMLGHLDEDARARLRLTSVGVVFQQDNLIEEFSAAENVAFPLELRGEPRGAIPAKVRQVLHKVGLAGMEDRRPWQLSGGQQQRVGIARALVGSRRVLLADEPTAALDSENSHALYELLALLAREGVAVVVASHDPLTRRYASRVAHMVDGRLSEE